MALAADAELKRHSRDAANSNYLGESLFRSDTVLGTAQVRGGPDIELCCRQSAIDRIDSNYFTGHIAALIEGETRCRNILRLAYT